MLYRLRDDDFEQQPTTGELICTLAGRFDAVDDMFIVLGLMIEVSGILAIDNTASLRRCTMWHCD